MFTLKRLSIVLFTIAVASLVEASALRRGPPTLCFALDIDSAVSLPLDGERSTIKDFVLGDATVKALLVNDDVVVHMETLRRAYFLAESPKERTLLLERLEHRVLDLALDDASSDSRAYALAWFDLGYWRRILDQGHENDRVKALPCVDKAIRMQPQDGGMRLGAIYLLVDHSSRRRDYYLAVAAAHEQAKDPQSRLGRNLKLTLEQFSPDLLEKGYDGIGAAARAKAGK